MLPRPKLLSRCIASSTPPTILASTSQPHITFHIKHHPFHQSPIHSTPRRLYSSDTPTSATPTQVTPPDYLSKVELSIFNKLKSAFDPSKLEVQDISGGCGSMFGLDIVSEKFKDMSVIKQHKLVNKVLEEEIKTWHGVQLKTKAA